MAAGTGICVQLAPSLVDLQNLTVPPPESHLVQVEASNWLWYGSQSIVQPQIAGPMVLLPQFVVVRPLIPLLIGVHVAPWLVLLKKPPPNPPARHPLVQVELFAVPLSATYQVLSFGLTAKS